MFQAFDRQSGDILWQSITSAAGHLDYGNSPRATPLIYDSLVFTLGAFGHLSCLDIETGIALWQINLQREFSAPIPIWGFCGSPIVVDDQLILQTGAPEASVVALDLVSGEVLWKASGPEAVYASPVKFGSQIISLDGDGIVAWNFESGSTQWRIAPTVTGDFGVPSAVPTEYGLLMTSENNGTRLYKYDGKAAKDELLGHVKRVAPNSHTPVVVDSSAFVAHKKLYSLSLENQLEENWVINDRAFRGYTSLLASNSKLLATTANCELILIDIADGKIVNRLRLAEDNMRTLAHPAIVGTDIFVRVGKKLMCIDLADSGQ